MIFNKQMMNDEKKWEICVHEASHLVFSRLINKLDLDFPPPTEVKISQNGNYWQGGTINGGWVEGNNSDEGQNQLKSLVKKSMACKVVQIMFLLAGYASYKAIIDSNKDLYPLHRVKLPCPPCPSDIDKCNKIAGRITGNSKFGKDRIGGWVINSDNLDILQPIKDCVARILEHKSIKWAIKFCAKKLKEYNQLEGNNLNNVVNIIDITLAKVSIESEVNQLVESFE